MTDDEPLLADHDPYSEWLREKRKERASCPHGEPNCSYGSGSCDCAR